MLEMQISVGLHTLAAAVFVGVNVLLERVVKRLDAVPPREAARLGELIGTDIVYINSGALAVLVATGVLLLQSEGTLASLTQPSFYGGGYGVALGLMILLWLTLIVSSCVMTFYLRPRMLVKLPYDVTRDALVKIGDKAMSANVWMTRFGRYNLAAGVVSILIGGFLHGGGF